MVEATQQERISGLLLYVVKVLNKRDAHLFNLKDKLPDVKNSVPLEQPDQGLLAMFTKPCS